MASWDAWAFTLTARSVALVADMFWTWLIAFSIWCSRDQGRHRKR